MATSNIKRTLVLNQTYEPISITSVEKAFTLCFLGKADMVEAHDVPLHTVDSTYDRPSVIRVKSFVRYNPYRNVELTRRNVIRRDNGKCVYCGSKDELTVDHIIPRSRGGENSWNNLVAACKRCNNVKDNKTPEEVGFVMTVKPRKPSAIMFLSKASPSLLDTWKPYLFHH